ncbi:putative StAR-related lipid transfer protein 3 [Hypsibius exemplaris]|uniref:StAR-related lipid transfer protein 3 n=1 Tax=Hypsibius exemplaris TaxID=2072580 RepID=A0A1W0WTS7_HYPEX|nr:putative StAR-related lipid transfer protein 3 [Hypsibius exemplaris]
MGNLRREKSGENSALRSEDLRILVSCVGSDTLIRNQLTNSGFCCSKLSDFTFDLSCFFGCWIENGNILINCTMACSCKCNCEQTMSPVRRTFCLLTLFDLVLTFLLWILYTQIKGQSPYEAFDTEVAHYGIHSSLFDLVMLAAFRFTSLILAYGLFALHNPWVVAVTTTISSGFLIAKVFLFAFTKEDRDSPILDYLLLVSSFVLPWAETWFLDFKVLPRELKERLIDLRRAASEISPLLYGRSRYEAWEQAGQSGMSSAFYSPMGGSPENRSLAGDVQVLPRKQTVVDVPAPIVPSPLTTDQKKLLLERGQSSLLVINGLLARSGWKLEKQGKNDSHVYSIHDKRFGKVFKIQGIIHASTADLFADIYLRVKDLPKWNSSVAHSERVDVLDDHTDICYVCVNDQAGGMVSGRDFLDVRCYEKTVSESEGTIKYVIASMGCEHVRKPVLSEFVRGVNGPNAWIIEAMPPGPDGEERSLFTSVLNTDLKGWIPQSIVDQALSTVLFDLIKSLQKKYSPQGGATAPGAPSSS